MKVLMVYDTLSPYAGGAQEVVFRWMKNLLKNGVDVKLVCDQSINKVAHDFPQDCFIINSSLPLLKNFPLQFRLQRSTADAILKFQPNLIHLHEQVFISQKILQFAQKHGIPVLNSFHGNAHKFKTYNSLLSFFIKEGGVVNTILHNAQQQMLRESNFLTAPTVCYQRELENAFHKNVFLLPYPIEEKFFVERKLFPRTPTKLLVVSRLAGEKNVHILIEMMQYLKGSASLTVIGDGFDRKYLEKRTQELGLHDVISFKGWIKNDQLPRVMQEHDLFLSASDFETFGITYIEALAAHLPCMVYDYPVSREVIPEKTSVFINSFDPKEWAHAVGTLQQNSATYKDLYQQITKKHQKIYGYKEQNSTKELMNIYQKVLTK